MNEFVLSDALLETCAARAAGYDRDNAFFTEDLDDLRQAGYLRAAIFVWPLPVAAEGPGCLPPHGSS